MSLRTFRAFILLDYLKININFSWKVFFYFFGPVLEGALGSLLGLMLYIGQELSRFVLHNFQKRLKERFAEICGPETPFRAALGLPGQCPGIIGTIYRTNENMWWVDSPFFWALIFLKDWLGEQLGFKERADWYSSIWRGSQYSGVLGIKFGRVISEHTQDGA